MIPMVYHCGEWWCVLFCVMGLHVVPLLATVREGGPHCDLLKVFAFLMHGGIWHIQTQHHSVSQYIICVYAFTLCSQYLQILHFFACVVYAVCVLCVLQF